MRVLCWTDAQVSHYRRPLKIRDFVWEIKYWDLRTPNNVKPNFSLNEMNKKDLPVMYSTVFWCLLVVLLDFLALLHNHCYFLHKTKPRLVISIWQGPGSVATKMLFFRRNLSPLQFFSAPTQHGNLFFLSKRSARKKLYNFPIKSSHLCRTSRHVWLSSSVCDHCCAFQLICIMTISTYTTGDRAHFFAVQEPSWRVISVLAPVV